MSSLGPRDVVPVRHQSGSDLPPFTTACYQHVPLSTVQQSMLRWTSVACGGLCRSTLSPAHSDAGYWSAV